MLLKNSQITTLDLHCTNDPPDLDEEPQEPTEFGLVDDEFLGPILYSLNKVENLNLFGQIKISEKLLVDFLTTINSSGLKSLCVNCIKLSPVFLDALLLPHVSIDRISMVECEIDDKQLAKWMDELKPGRFRRIHCSSSICIL
jgi:hypothetical protein